MFAIPHRERGTPPTKLVARDNNGMILQTRTVNVVLWNGQAYAAPDSYRAVVGRPLTINVRANDNPDPEGDTVTLTITTPPEHGTLVEQGGALVYTPNAGYTGSDSFAYTLSDGLPNFYGPGNSEPTTVSLQVLDPISINNSTIGPQLSNGGPSTDSPASPALGMTTWFGALQPNSYAPGITAAEDAARQARIAAYANWQGREAAEWTNLNNAVDDGGSVLANALQSSSRQLAEAALVAANADFVAINSAVTEFDRDHAQVANDAHAMLGDWQDQQVTGSTPGTSPNPGTGANPGDGTNGSLGGTITQKENIPAGLLKDLTKNEYDYKLANAEADGDFSGAVDLAVQSYGLSIEKASDNYDRRAAVATGEQILATISASIEHTRKVRKALVDYRDRVQAVKQRWADDITAAQTDYVNAISPAFGTFNQDARQAVDDAVEALRLAFADWYAADDEYQNFNPRPNNPLRQEAYQAFCVARATAEKTLAELLKDHVDCLVDVEQSAMETLLAAFAEANRTFAIDLAKEREKLRKALDRERIELNRKLVGAAIARDNAMGVTETKAFATRIAAEDAFLKSVNDAAKQHDERIVSAAAQRDIRYLELVASTYTESASGSGAGGKLAAIKDKLFNLVRASKRYVSGVIDVAKNYNDRLIGADTQLLNRLNEGEGGYNERNTAALAVALRTGLNIQQSYLDGVGAADKLYADESTSKDVALAQSYAAAMKDNNLAALTALYQPPIDALATLLDELANPTQPLSIPQFVGLESVERPRADIQPILEALAQWDARKAAFLAPLADVPALPAQYGLDGATPAWIGGLSNSLADWFFVPDPTEDPTFHHEAMVAAGLDPLDPQLPSWLGDLAGQVKAGKAALGTLDDGLQTASTELITATNWSTLADPQGLYVGAIPDANGKVVRLVGTQARRVDSKIVNAELSQSVLNGTRRTDADWDLWFAAHGATVSVTQTSKDALASAIGLRVAALDSQIGTLSGKNNWIEIERVKVAKASYEEAKRRCDALALSLDQTPLTYAQYLALAKQLLGDGVGQSLADQFGLVGLQRLVDLTNAGWKISVQTDYYIDSETGYAVVGGAYGVSQSPRAVTINNIRSAPFGNYEYLLNVQVALRVFEAINHSTVTLNNTGFLGFDQFWTTTRVMGLVQVGFATAQIAGSVTSAIMTGGIAAAPAWYGVVSGLNSFQEGLDAFANDNPDARGFLRQTVDKVTGNQNVTNGMLFVADFGQSLAQSRALLQTKALANQQAAAATVANVAVNASEELVDDTSKLVRTVADIPERAAAPNNAAHNAADFARYKAELARLEALSPADPMRGTVMLRRPVAGATAAQEAQIREYLSIANLSELEGYMSPTGRVSTTGSLRSAADRAARAERLRASAAGSPYRWVVGHGPDTTWTGRPDAPFWVDLERSINSSLGRQALDYPVGFRPSRFIYEGDY